MLRQFTAILAGAAVALSVSASALAAGGDVKVVDKDWSFEGPFGQFDPAQLQRGWQVFSEVCAACHGLKYLTFRELGDPRGPAFPKAQVDAIAAAYPAQIAALDEFGEPTTRAPKAEDAIPSPYPNEEAAKLANNGAYPPDLSLITKARTGYTGIFNQLVNGIGGPEYVYSVLIGYTDTPPEGFDVGSLAYNKYYPGHKIAMYQPLYDDSVSYQGDDAPAATKEQLAADVTAFLAWAAEPRAPYRKEAGAQSLLFMLIFTVLLWYSNRQLWKPIKEGGSAN